MNAATVVQRLWNDCNVVRDDGMSYGDYLSASLWAAHLSAVPEDAQTPMRIAGCKSAVSVKTEAQAKALMEQQGVQVSLFFRAELVRIRRSMAGAGLALKRALRGVQPKRWLA